jgi:ribosomal protein S18 acetylase RimI-like enzyme
MRSAITTGKAAAKRILPEKWIASLRRKIVWLRRQRVRIFGPASVYMVRDDLENLPPVELPEGYQVTPVTPQTEMDFLKVLSGSLRESANLAWYRRLQDDPEYDPRNLLLVRKGETPVAAVVAWQKTWEGEKVGQPHTLGVDPDFRGQGLARAVMILSLHRSRERGFKRALFITEDHFIPALSLYLSLGAKPVYFNWFHKRRWEKILRKIRSSVRK